MGLIKNTVINDIAFFRNYKKTIQKDSNKGNFVFIGLGYKSTIWIKDGEALVLRKSEIGFVSAIGGIQKLNKGDGFVIQSK
jgi:hypothetical protein